MIDLLERAAGAHGKVACIQLLKQIESQLLAEVLAFQPPLPNAHDTQTDTNRCMHFMQKRFRHQLKPLAVASGGLEEVGEYIHQSDTPAVWKSFRRRRGCQVGSSIKSLEQTTAFLSMLMISRLPQECMLKFALWN